MSTYGIDLGTTYSCIARLDANGNPEVIRNNEDDSNTVASVVFFENESNVIVGQAAKENIETDGDRVVQFVKREIGKRPDRIYEFLRQDLHARGNQRIDSYAAEKFGRGAGRND